MPGGLVGGGLWGGVTPAGCFKHGEFLRARGNNVVGRGRTGGLVTQSEKIPGFYLYYLFPFLTPKGFFFVCTSPSLPLRAAAGRHSRLWVIVAERYRSPTCDAPLFPHQTVTVPAEWGVSVVLALCTWTPCGAEATRNRLPPHRCLLDSCRHRLSPLYMKKFHSKLSGSTAELRRMKRA